MKAIPKKALLSHLEKRAEVARFTAKRSGCTPELQATIDTLEALIGSVRLDLLGVVEVGKEEVD